MSNEHEGLKPEEIPIHGEREFFQKILEVEKEFMKLAKQLGMSIEDLNKIEERYGTDKNLRNSPMAYFAKMASISINMGILEPALLELCEKTGQNIWQLDELAKSETWEKYLGTKLKDKSNE